MDKTINNISKVILFVVFALESLFSQIVFDTVHLSHSPFLEYEMGFALTYTNYAPNDFKKLNSKDITFQERREITSKYFPEKLEFVATTKGWYNPLNIFKIEFNNANYFFTFPHSIYRIEPKNLNSDFCLTSTKIAKLWKHDGQTINLILHYKDSFCIKFEYFKTSIPSEFLLAEYEKGLVMFEIIVENELEHKLKSVFRIW